MLDSIIMEGVAQFCYCYSAFKGLLELILQSNSFSFKMFRSCINSHMFRTCAVQYSIHTGLEMSLVHIEMCYNCKNISNFEDLVQVCITFLTNNFYVDFMLRWLYFRYIGLNLISVRISFYANEKTVRDLCFRFSLY